MSDIQKNDDSTEEANAVSGEGRYDSSAKIKKTTFMIQDIDDTKKRVEESYTETEKLKAEYERMSQETQDMIAHLKFARSKIKSVIKYK